MSANTVWVTTGSLHAADVYHTDPECHTIETDDPTDGPKSQLPDNARCCKYCNGSVETGESYESYAKKLRHGELDPDDIVEPFDDPAGDPDPPW